MKNFFQVLLPSCLIGRGALIILRPAIYYICLNIGDTYEKYIRVINGPFPFSQFGSGPFQLIMILGSVIVGAFLMYLGYRISSSLSR